MYSVAKVKSFRGTDGYGFNVDLLKDGRRIAFVIDEGCGGCLHFEWLDIKDKGVLEEHVKTLPPLKSQYGDMVLDIDLFVSSLVDEHESEKKLKRLCRTKTLFRLKADEVGSYRVINRQYDEKVKDFIKGKYGDGVEVIYNEKH